MRVVAILVGVRTRAVLLQRQYDQPVNIWQEVTLILAVYYDDYLEAKISCTKQTFYYSSHPNRVLLSHRLSPYLTKKIPTQAHYTCKKKIALCQNRTSDLIIAFNTSDTLYH